MNYQIRHKINISRQLWLCCGLAICMLSGSSGYAAELVAKKDEVKVHSEKSTKSPVVATLKKGEVVSTIKRAGMLWKVETENGSEGFVKVFDVSIKASDDNGLVDAMRDAARSDGDDMDSVKSNRSRSAVMGVRGLDESSKTSFAGNVKPNFELVDRMEGYRVEGAAIASLEERLLKESSLRAQK